METYRLQLFYP